MRLPNNKSARIPLRKNWNKYNKRSNEKVYFWETPWIWYKIQKSDQINFREQHDKVVGTLGCHSGGVFHQDLDLDLLFFLFHPVYRTSKIGTKSTPSRIRFRQTTCTSNTTLNELYLTQSGYKIWKNLNPKCTPENLFAVLRFLAILCPKSRL